MTRFSIFLAAALLEVGGDALIRKGLRVHGVIFVVAGWEKAIDLDLLIGAHQGDGGRRRRHGGVAHEIPELHESRRAENFGGVPTEHTEDTEEI